MGQYLNLLDINIILLFISFLLLGYGTVLLLDITFNTIRAKKKLKELLKNNPRLNEKAIQDYKETKKGNEQKFLELQEIIKKELNKLSDNKEKESIREILDKSTEDDKKRFINSILT